MHSWFLLPCWFRKETFCFPLLSTAVLLSQFHLWRKLLVQLFSAFNTYFFVVVGKVPASLLLCCIQLVEILILRLTQLTDKTKWQISLTSLNHTVGSLQKQKQTFLYSLSRFLQQEASFQKVLWITMFFFLFHFSDSFISFLFGYIQEVQLYLKRNPYMCCRGIILAFMTLKGVRSILLRNWAIRDFFLLPLK